MRCAEFWSDVGNGRAVAEDRKLGKDLGGGLMFRSSVGLIAPERKGRKIHGSFPGSLQVRKWKSAEESGGVGVGGEKGLLAELCCETVKISLPPLFLTKLKIGLCKVGSEERKKKTEGSYNLDII